MAQLASLRAYLAIAAGFGIQLLLVKLGAELPSYVSTGLGLLAGGVLVYGTALVAESKGYSAWVGLAGVLSILGTGVVLLLPPSEGFPRPWRRLRATAGRDRAKAGGEKRP
jgi:hypothetical protein